MALAIGIELTDVIVDGGADDLFKFIDTLMNRPALLVDMEQS